MTTKMAEDEALLERLTDPIWNHMLANYQLYPSWQLVFNESGMLRLTATLAFIDGLRQTADGYATAVRLARLLDEQLQYLATYGGEVLDFEGERLTRPLRLFKIELGDDGLFGCFTVQWYKVIAFSVIERQTIAQGQPLTGEAIRATMRELQVCPEMGTEERDLVNGGHETFHYRSVMNGGLILHGNTNLATAAWSVHT